MPDAKVHYEDVLPDLEQLCRVHDVGLELIEHSDDVDSLIDRVLDEYERRLADLRHDTLTADEVDANEARKLRALVMFATQASALMQKARAVDERHKLERLSGVMQTLGVLSHKINNPLTSLLGRAQMLKAQSRDDPWVENACEVIEDSARRIAGYIKELSEVVREGRADALDTLLDTERPEV